MKALVSAVILGLSTAGAWASADQDWAAVTTLDGGPKQAPTSREEAEAIENAFLLKQLGAVQAFLQRNPGDPRAFEAQARLAAVWAAQSKLRNEPTLMDQALELLGKLEQSPTATDTQHADAGFVRTSLILQNKTGTPEQIRDAIVAEVQSYCDRYPGDRRGPRLLVEAATLCDNDPTLKRRLLTQANQETKELALKRRIADDFLRLNQLGQKLDFQAATLDGKKLQLSSLRGNLVLLIFWSSEAPQSLIWLRDFRMAYQKMSPAGLKVVTINLDISRGAMEARLVGMHPDWLTCFDGKGWEGTLPRGLGINALPSVWLLDRQGVVRSINAKTNFAALIDQFKAK